MQNIRYSPRGTTHSRSCPNHTSEWGQRPRSPNSVPDRITVPGSSIYCAGSSISVPDWAQQLNSCARSTDSLGYQIRSMTPPFRSMLVGDVSSLRFGLSDSVFYIHFFCLFYKYFLRFTRFNFIFSKKYFLDENFPKIIIVQI